MISEMPRVFWFEDKLKMSAPTMNRSRVSELNKRLVGLLSNQTQDHIIIDSELSAQRLLDNLNVAEFSLVIDISGFISKTFQDRLDGTRVVDQFRLSRLRKVSSPRLDSVGYVQTHTQTEIQRIKTELDLSRVLILDDIGWSGRSVIETAKLWGLNLPNTTFGFLVGNEGTFGTNHPGAISLLNQRGAEVVTGFNVSTPRDDGFHLEDFFTTSDLGNPEVFNIILEIQKLREEASTQESETRKQTTQEISTLLTINSHLFFAQAITSEKVAQMEAEGLATIKAGISKHSLFDTNPVNFLLPSLGRRIKASHLEKNTREIIDTLRETQHLLTNEINHEPSFETSLRTKERG